ncbi:MAG: hypothetical protein AAEJ47_03195 [Planctomycetota bacterium]
MRILLVIISSSLLALLLGCVTLLVGPTSGSNPTLTDDVVGVPKGETADIPVARVVFPVEPLAPFVDKALDWLANAQHESGGWGSGSHSAQDIRDPHKVQTDPASTAFSGMALLREGSNPVTGKYMNHLRKATEYLVRVVSEADDNGPAITSLKGTQPQTKLGQFIDTSMTLQFLSRILPKLPESDALHQQVDQALDKCLAKLQNSQLADGSWGGGSWAGVLQSSVGCSALEWAAAAGKTVDKEALTRARDHQKGNFDAETGRSVAEDSAGIELYAFAGAQRAAASEAGAARQIIEDAKKEGRLDQDAECNAENLRLLGLDEPRAQTLAGAYAQNMAQLDRLNDERMLSGFGNNGGEEFLSYMLTSESLVLQGGNAWPKWKQKMNTRMGKIQIANGSWTGHHCITSPVFCTAAVIQCLTADRDEELLRAINEQDASTKPESL